MNILEDLELKKEKTNYCLRLVNNELFKLNVVFQVWEVGYFERVWQRFPFVSTLQLIEFNMNSGQEAEYTSKMFF